MKCETYNDALGQFMMATMLIKSVDLAELNPKDAARTISDFMILLNTCIDLAKKEKKFEDADNLMILRKDLISALVFGAFDSTMEDDND